MGRVRLDAFELEGLLGQGGMGAVWRGRHRPSGAAVAVKLLRPSSQWGDRAAQWFAREVRAVASLHHPSVVHVLDFGEVTEAEARQDPENLVCAAPWMVMELCSGGTLAAHRGSLGWPRVRPVLLTLLDALAHAHARGVIHRDIKPSNVLVGTGLDHRPGLKLSDFGLAALRDPSSGDRSGDDGFAGSPAYCSPEQLRGDSRRLGPWSDLYSVGCLAWALMCGDPPHGRSHDLARVVAAQAGGRLRPFEPVDPSPPELVGWLHALLARQPEDRFQSAADAAWALRELAATSPEEEDFASGTLAGLVPQDRDSRTGVQLSHDSASATELHAASQFRTRAVLRAESPGRGQDRRWPPSVEAPSRLGPEGFARGRRPPLPSDWRREESSPPLRLLGAGLGLYESRTVPLTGREAERDTLWAALHDVVREGTVRCVLVSGPSGLGKSRLVGWIGQRAQELGIVRVARAVHGSPAGPADGLGPLVRRWLRLEGCKGEGLVAAAARWFAVRGESDPYLPVAAAELVEPGVSRRLDGVQRLEFGSPEQRWQAVARFLDADCSHRPVLLWVDDLQWGPDTAGLVGHLLERRSVERRELLILGTVRDAAGSMSTAMRTELDRLTALEGASELILEPLGEAAQGRLVAELLHLDEPTSAQVVERTGGNPLFALQLVGDWVRRGVLVAGRGGFEPAPGTELKIPDGLHELWRERILSALSQLPGFAQELAELAAVIGARVDSKLWQQASRQPAAQLAAVLEALVRGGIARTVGEDWEFTHGMARESLLRSAAEGGRIRVQHGLCADALEEVEAPQQLARRGRHRHQAGRHVLAAADLELALDHAEARGDGPEEASLLEELRSCIEASELGPGSAAMLRCRFRELRMGRRIGTALGALREGLRSLVEEASASGFLEVEVEVKIELGRSLRDGGELPEGARLLREAFDLGVQEDLPALTARAGTGLGWARLLAGESREALDLFRHAAGLFGRTGQLSWMAKSYLGLAEAYRMLHETERARHFAVRGLEAAEGAGALKTRADACLHLATIDLSLKGPEEARAWVERARTDAERCGSVAQLAGILNLAGEVERRAGDLLAAEAAFREGIATFDALGGSWSSMLRLNLAMVLMERGRFAEARQPLLKARESLVADRRGALLEVVGLLLVPVHADAGEARELGLLLEELEAVERWRRPSKECCQALSWAAPIAERRGLSDFVKRIRDLERRHALQVESRVSAEP